MNNIGIIAGIGPESSIQYYRLIIKLYRERLATMQYPKLLLHSIDMTTMLDFVFSDNLDGLITFLQKEIQVLEKAGVDYVALASNTPHLVFDQLQEKVAVPLISIVEETCEMVKQSGLKKVGLLGTKSTMSKGFYQQEGLKNGLEIIIPNEADQDFVHDKYMGELVFNNIVPATKTQLIQLVNDMKKNQGIEGIILGGTELPLILKEEDFETMTVFNTTVIHVNAILDKMIN